MQSTVVVIIDLSRNIDIAVAKNYSSAIKYLIQNKFIDENTKMSLFNDGERLTFKEIWYDEWQSKLTQFGLEAFNDSLTGYYLVEMDVFGL